MAMFRLHLHSVHCMKVMHSLCPRGSPGRSLPQYVSPKTHLGKSLPHQQKILHYHHAVNMSHQLVDQHILVLCFLADREAAVSHAALQPKSSSKAEAAAALV